MTTLATAILAIFISLLGPLLTIFDLPGNTIMIITRVGFALIDERYLDMEALLIAALIYVAGESWDFFISIFGIKKEKISWGGVLLIAAGGFAGACLGTGILPLLGSFIGGLAGAAAAAFLYEYNRTQNAENAKELAWKAAKVRCLAMLGKLTAAFCLSYMLASSILRHVTVPQLPTF